MRLSEDKKADSKTSENGVRKQTLWWLGAAAGVRFPRLGLWFVWFEVAAGVQRKGTGFSCSDVGWGGRAVGALKAVCRQTYKMESDP